MLFGACGIGFLAYVQATVRIVIVFGTDLQVGVRLSF